MKKIVSIITLALITSMVFAQTHTTEGTDFWLTFMSNYTRQPNDNALQLKLIISAREQTSVTVSNPNTSWTKTVNVAGSNISEIIIPNQQCYTSDAEKISKTGINVKADKPISLYASNYSDASYDATNVLPLNVLTGNYIIQTYEVSREEAGYAKEFAVVATDNNTLIEINPHARTTTGKLKNIPFTITLNKGEVYQVMSVDDNNNLSGSTIHASKPVAVFSGNQCANVPSGCDWCDHIVEQAMPTSLWGKQFAVTAALQQTENRIMITAQTAGTEVRVNGIPKITLEQYQSYEYIMGSDEWSCYIETTYPSACYLYIEGGKKHKGMGDPSSVHISPFEQKIDKMTFSTFATSRSQWHYVNIVTTANAKAGMQLDGKYINAYFTALDGNNDLVYARIKVDHGTHTLTNTIDGFTAWVYGLGTSESYAYTAGSAAIPLDAQILVDGRPSNETEMRTFCNQHLFTFKPQVNIDYTNVSWNFGDGKTATTPTAQHQYNKTGDYIVSMIVSNSEEEQTISTVLHLVDTQKDTTYAIICDNEEYIFNGNKYTQEGTYPVKLKSKDGCDSIAVLVLKVTTSYTFSENKQVARGQTFHWRGGRYTAGTYYDSLLTVQGCDSVYKLVLTEVDAPAAQKDTICYEPTYLFMGHEYPLPPIDNHKDDKYIPYRLKYYDEEACLTYIMDLAIVPAQEQTIEIYDTISAGTKYNFHGKSLTSSDTYIYKEPLGCNGSYIEILHLVVMPYPIIESSFELCKITDNIKFYNHTIDKEGEYFDTVYTDIGLGEIRHLIVTDNKTYGEISVSNVDSYTINGQTYTKTGTYTQILTNAAGCDSILTINIGINSKCEVTEESATILCEGQTLKWNNQVIDKAGDFQSDILISSHGCDSIAVLHVEMPKKDTILIEETICEGDFLKYNDEIITTSGDHFYTFTSSKGCDSVVNVNITINKSYFNSIQRTIIEGKDIVWNGTTYTEEGFYTQTFIDKNGCDSILELQLTVIEQPKQYQHAIFLNTSKAWSKYNYFSVYYWDDYSSGYISMQQLNCDENVYFAVLPYGEWENVIFRCHNSYAGEATNTWGSAVMQTVDLKYSQDKPQFCINTNNNYATGYWTEANIQDNCELCINSTKTLIAPIAGDLYVWDNGEIGNARTLTADTPGKQTYTCKVYNINPTVKDNLMPNGDFEIVPDDTTKFVAFYSEYKNYGFQPNFRYSIYQPYLTPTFDPLNTFAVVCNQITFIDQPSFYLMPHGNYALYIDGGMDKNVSMAWQAKSTDHPDLKIIKDSLYIFSYFVLGGGYENPAVLQFSLSYKNENGTYTQLNLGEPYTTIGHGVLAGITHEDWVQKKIIFKAPVTSNDISIQLYDLTFAPLGNDFVLDDICFNLVTEKNKSIISEYNIEMQVNDITYGYEEKTIIKGESYTFHGKTYNETGSFNTTLKGQNQYGCDSIITLHLTVTDPVPVKPIRNRTINTAICQGDNYDFYGEIITEPKTEYTHKIEYAQYDSIITLNLTVNPTYNNQITEKNIIQGESLTWNGRTFTEPVELTIDSFSQYGCDSIITLRLTVTDPVPVKPIRNRTINTAICQGDSYDFYGEIITEPKTEYTHKIEYAQYDSIITLNLTVNPTYNNQITEKNIIQGESLTWNGRTFTEPVELTIDSFSQYGCDSIITLRLTVTDPVPVKPKDVINMSTEAIICDGEHYDFYGTTLTHNGTYTHETEYDDYIQVDELTLIVNPRYQRDTTITIMQGETLQWGDRTLTQTGYYPLALQTIHGCDSTIILFLRIQQKTYEHVEQTAIICEGGSYDFYGTQLTKSGTYTHTVTSITADTTITLRLAIEQPQTTYIDYILPDGSYYTVNNNVYSFPGDYEIILESAHGCDSIIKLHLETASSQRIDNAEIYVATPPCADDGIVTLHLNYDNQPDSVKLTFSGRDNAKGFDALMITDVSNDLVIQHNARAGKYTVEAALYKKGKIAKTIKQKFTLIYPSAVIEQRWNDALVVLTAKYNGGYDFKKFQWYKNGEKLEGETGSYLYQPLEMGAAYAAMLTENNGISLMSCPVIAEPHQDISLYPTHYRPGQRAIIKVSEDATMYIYDATGKMIAAQPVETGESQQNIPQQIGIYIVNIVLNQSQYSQQFKLIVER